MWNWFLWNCNECVDRAIVTAEADEGSCSFGSNNERTCNRRSRFLIEICLHSIKFFFGIKIKCCTNWTCMRFHIFRKTWFDVKMVGFHAYTGPNSRDKYIVGQLRLKKCHYFRELLLHFRSDMSFKIRVVCRFCFIWCSCKVCEDVIWKAGRIWCIQFFWGNCINWFGPWRNNLTRCRHCGNRCEKIVTKFHTIISINRTKCMVR